MINELIHAANITYNDDFTWEMLINHYEMKGYENFIRDNIYRHLNRENNLNFSCEIKVGQLMNNDHTRKLDLVRFDNRIPNFPIREIVEFGHETTSQSQQNESSIINKLFTDLLKNFTINNFAFPTFNFLILSHADNLRITHLDHVIYYFNILQGTHLPVFERNGFQSHVWIFGPFNNLQDVRNLFNLVPNNGLLNYIRQYEFGMDKHNLLLNV
jgi:hypothetical protein